MLHHILPGFSVLTASKVKLLENARNIARGQFGSVDAGEDLRLVATGTSRDVGPAFEPEGCHGGRDLLRGIEED